ncbi:MAG: AtpZ/AtpI family protein [Firmicutes bacterium]|nr:AtpZ/AtpI family protein [Bacillota bacterium]
MPGMVNIDFKVGACVGRETDFSGLLTVCRVAAGIALPLVAGVLLGRRLGERYGHEPLFVAGGALLGLVSGFRQAVRLLLKK